MLKGDSIDQLAQLFDGLGYHLSYAREHPFWSDPEVDIGNAIASRCPIMDKEQLPLAAMDNRENRVALFCTIDAPVGTLEFACTHLNWPFYHGAIREQQVLQVCSRLMERSQGNGFPPILVGDFNAEPHSSEIRYVTGLHALQGQSMYCRDTFNEMGGDDEGFSWSNDNPYARLVIEPNRRIDYIFMGAVQPNGVGITESCQLVCDQPDGDIWPSDHFGVYAKCRDKPLSQK